MKLTQKELKELENIKSSVRNDMEHSRKINSLYEQKNQVIKYLTLMVDTKENKELIKKFNKLDVRLKILEEQAAFVIAKEEKQYVIVKKSILSEKKIINKYSESEYEKRFNNLLKKTNYLDIMKQRSKLFKELEKVNIEDSSVVYKLDSLETEISTIETDAIRRYILEN